MADLGRAALVVSLTEFIYQLKLEAMLAKAFELEGYSPVFLVQPGSKTAPRYLRAFGIRRFVSLDEYVDGNVEAAAGRETASEPFLASSRRSSGGGWPDALP